MLTSILLVLLAAIPVEPAPPTDTNLEFGKIEHRLIEPADEDGDVYVSVKVPITNIGGEDLKVSLTDQALDEDNFEVVDVPLEGRVGAGETRVLTDTFFIQEAAFLMIVEWQLED